MGDTGAIVAGDMDTVVIAVMGTVEADTDMDIAEEEVVMVTTMVITVNHINRLQAVVELVALEISVVSGMHLKDLVDSEEDLVVLESPTLIIERNNLTMV